VVGDVTLDVDGEESLAERALEGGRRPQVGEHRCVRRPASGPLSFLRRRRPKIGWHSGQIEGRKVKQFKTQIFKFQNFFYILNILNCNF
jgi:hypothetical protein